MKITKNRVLDVIATTVVLMAFILVSLYVVFIAYEDPFFLLGWIIIGSGLYLIGWASFRFGGLLEKRKRIREAKRDKQNEV